MGEILSPERATGIKRLLWVALACASVLGVFAVLAGAGGNTAYAVTLGVSALCLIASAGFTLRALEYGDPRARRGALLTGVLMLVLALPAVQIWVGLIMAISGIGLFFVVLSKDAEQ